jgi:[acyl-carrier-protein] S-malonyltransferase
VVTILLFPGQGSQKVGMAKDLAAQFPAARDTLTAIDAALDLPLSALMGEGPEEELVRTQNAQPAILAHSAAVLAVVADRLGPVAAAAGHSLGEYSAWLASGALGPVDAARLVRRRGELMFAAGQQRPGAMAAVLGLPSVDVEQACARAAEERTGVVVAANLNAPDQTVISGDPAAVTRAGAHCHAAGAKRVLPLKVSGAFHSPLMEPAVAPLREAIAAVALRPAAFPVVTNVTADVAQSNDEMASLLIRQLTAPVRWWESMRRLDALYPGARWLEIGPGSVLTGLLKRIIPGAQCTPLGTAAQVEEFLAA